MNNDLKTWMQASRPFSFPASIVPVLVGAMFTLAYHEGPVMWWLFPIVLVASVLFHAATNLVSEYFDYKKGVDREETFGSSRVLVEKMMKPKSVLYGGIAAFALGFLLGLVLVYFRGTDMLLLGLIGLAGGFFYTGWPIGY
ncbi:MAG: prenyltransferase, partial [Bacteroidota bacterium]